jgi:phage baseplate assembly protein W
MPEDIAIMADVNQVVLSPEVRAALGTTQYVFSSYNNDLQFDQSGKIILMSGAEKLSQSTIKVLLTEQGSAAEDTQYGAQLAALLGNKITNDVYTNLVDTIQQAIIHYNEINGDNDSSDEYVDTIDEIEVSSDSKDPRIIVIKIKMTNEAGEQISLTVPALE